MKLVGFCAGRKYGNTEVFIKEALMAAEEKGIEVEFIRLKDFELSKCTACDTFCNRDIDKCPHHKDDAPFIIEKFLDSDGVIIGGPVYSLTPSSLFFTFRDRVFGPKMDVASVWELGQDEMPFVKGRFKARPGALVSVGGALTENWTTLGIPNLYSATFSAQTDIVDHLNVYGVSDPGEATIHEDWLAKAHKLGENVADAMLTGDHSWRGEKEGTCPGCHLNLVEIQPGTNKALCPICGIYGEVSMEDGVVKITWPDDLDHRRDDRLCSRGKAVHLREIGEHMGQYKPNIPKAMEQLKKYKEYNACEVKSPFKEAKKAELLAKAGKGKASDESKGETMSDAFARQFKEVTGTEQKVDI